MNGLGHWEQFQTPHWIGRTATINALVLGLVRVLQTGLLVIGLVIATGSMCSCLAQMIQQPDLNGLWKVSKYLSLVGPTRESPYEKRLDKKYLNRCLHARLRFKSNSMTVSIQPDQACGFPGCSLFVLTKLIQLKRVPDTYDSNSRPGISDGTVSSSLLKILGVSANSLSMWETNCSWYGVPGTVDIYSILILGKKRIALYTFMDIIILERIR